MTKDSQPDLIIVGAGPAGLSAAVVAAEHGLVVTILDEFPEPGGRMLGQFHEEKGHWWVGKQIAHNLIEQCCALGVHIRCGVSVHGMWKNGHRWVIRTSDGSITAANVLLATGGAEIPQPSPGWTLPGVMSIGAAQVMTNVHFVKPGRRGLIIGVNVLAMAIARELSVSGVSIAAIVLPSQSPLSGKDALPKENVEKLLGLAHLAPSPLMRMGGRAAHSLKMAGVVTHYFPRGGIKLWDIPLKLRTTAIAINGKDRVESVTLADLNGRGEMIAGSEREEKVDFVALAGGLYPLAELASVAGCPFVYIKELGGHIPLHSEEMQTPVAGLYVAGNITGVESALVAMAQGQLAATSICRDAGLLGSQSDTKIAEAKQKVQQVRASALIQFHPGIPKAREQVYKMWAKGCDCVENN
ncbi:sarcosine oxidase subunit alpha [Paenibacillus algorifonticola]|uniref:Sarcosine oxidase subunit alpha n=1 Tax=Paenibacillus algorifonticola TaxID=684063 RepID=A0A1I2C283_9BACL|nr:FAD-dependent oxidoreductase [Paenibacillus algorifonticola]SFE62272.1 sarcosine oxidase subunit alpha [Paenibacillus algorifonticola]